MYCNMCKYWDDYTVICIAICANIEIILLYVLQYVQILRLYYHMCCNLRNYSDNTFMCKYWDDYTVICIALCVNIQIILLYVLQYVQILRWLYCYMYCNMCKYSDYTVICSAICANIEMIILLYVLQYVQIFRLYFYMYCNMFQYLDFTVICTAVCANIEMIILLYVLRYVQICLFCCFTFQVNSYGHGGTYRQFTLPRFFLGKLEKAVNQYFVHILSLVTDNNPSWMIQRNGGEWL